MRAAIIGMGHQGKKHAKVLDELGVDYFAVDRVATMHDGGFDFAIISCPDAFHYTYVMDFLKKGVPVFCEKPLCLHPHELEDIEDRVRRTDGIISMNLPMRSRTGSIDCGLPPIYRMDASYNWGRKDEKRDWKKGDPHLVGGIHLIDIMRLKMGLVVDAETVRTDTTAMSIIQFEKGIGTLTSDLQSPPPHEHLIRAYSDDRVWEYDGERRARDGLGLATFVLNLAGYESPLVSTEDVLSLMQDIFKL